MPYDFYCTGCGRKLTQEKGVLFNMGPLLVRSIKPEDQLKMISFRMTQAELLKLVDEGKRDEEGWYRCSLKLADLADKISNSNNMNDSDIAGLTLDDIYSYTKLGVQVDLGETQDYSSDEETEFAGLAGNSAQHDESADSQSSASALPDTEQAVSKAIAALEGRNIKNADRTFAKENLVSDLTVFKNLYPQNADFTFYIQLKFEKDNDGREIVVGYDVQSGAERKTVVVNNARVCKHCKRALFEHAGTAEHRSVVFIGGPNSGKTSAILALAHYAQNGLIEHSKHPVWDSFGPIMTVSTRELLGRTERFNTDFENYGNGIAPPKTDARERKDAYSITFRIRNGIQGDKYYLLTLTDVPGDICNEKDGTIEESMIRNEFQVALSCQAYILCFDTVAAGQHEWQKAVDNVCSWANLFQQMRYNREKNLHDGAPGYVPLMVLYTKCQELEASPSGKQPRNGEKRGDAVLQTHCLYDESQSIHRTGRYELVGDQLQKTGVLKRCYQACMRVSPFGYPAKHTEDPEFDPAKVQDPQPRNIHRLMRWILEISGCIPVGAEYRTDTQLYAPENNFVERIQYRNQKPHGDKTESKRREALARCYLFKNPGQFDKEYVQSYKNFFETLMLCAKNLALP